MRSFTRGSFLLMAAQGVLMLSGYVLNVFLARYFGPEIYGTYGVAMAVLVLIELFVINGVPTAMQKFLSESADKAAAIVYLGRRLQLGYALVILVAFLAFVPLFSAGLHDPTFKMLLWVAAPDILIYGFYWFYLGVHSGLHRYENQALIIASYGVSKVVCCIVLSLSGMGITGALVGNFLGSAVGLAIGAGLMRRVHLPRPIEFVHHSLLTKFAVPIVLYTLSNNALLYIDLIFVKHFLAPAAAGHYTAATTIARVPYFIFLGLASTVLPSLSRLLAQENFTESQKLLRQTMRLLFGLLIPVLILVMVNAESIVELLYAEMYYPATSILQILIFGIAMYTLLVVLSTIMSAEGYANRAFHISLLAAVIDAVLCVILVPPKGVQGAAMATLVASACGVSLAGMHVMKKFSSILPWRSLLRFAIAGAMMLGLSMLWQSAGLMIIVELASLFGFYVFVLYLLGELKSSESI